MDNANDPSTGTLHVRGIFPNPDRLLSPGLFVRIRLPIGYSHKAILVPEKALQTDQGQKFLYVVNAVSGKEGVEYQVEYRAVKVGMLRGGMRVIEAENLKPGEKAKAVKLDERIIVSGLQRVRNGAKVSPKEAEPAAPDPGDKVTR